MPMMVQWLLCTTLIEMRHPQPSTPIQTDNSNASGITNGTFHQRKSKAMDMQFVKILTNALILT
jgi:hypothetical protein